ncbi:MAG: YceI family protein [Actinobacteria bacterium]|nr:YceI family protein [Actinomycetota bacterium]
MSVRTIEGREVPAAGTWAVDPSHSTASFVVRHLGLAKVRGGFGVLSGNIQVAEKPEDSSVEVEIDAASIDTGDQGRDDHLRSPDFLDVAEYPNLTFRSTAVVQAKDGWKVTGDLGIHGITKGVELDVTFEGAATDPWGGNRIGLSATTEFNREDFGLTWNQALETGGVLVGKQVKVEIEVEAVLQG